MQAPSSGSGHMMSIEIGPRQTSHDFYISRENLAAARALLQNILIIIS